MKLIHMVMTYHCKSCGSDANMYLEKGLEEGCNSSLQNKSGLPHKPVPFCIKCPNCSNGFMSDTSYIGFPDFLVAPEGINLFVNDSNSNCGKPVFNYKESEEK